MALAADERTHFLTRSADVDVVVLIPWAAFKLRMPSIKPGRVTRSCIVSGAWQSMQAIGLLPNEDDSFGSI